MKPLATITLALGLALAPALAQAGGGDDKDIVGKKWLLSLGGKLYDNLWSALNITPPKGRNPQYPAGADIPAAGTWRCVACHGWDYRGREGQLKKLRNSPRFVSLRPLDGKTQADVARRIRAKHPEFNRVLPPPMLNALAFFIARGQHDVTRVLDAKGRARGDVLPGKDIFEGVCISCHQADGKAYIEGEPGDRPALGWVARYRPEQALHKIRNGVPGADMLSLRFLDMKQIADLLAYAQTLDPTPEEPPSSGD